MPDWGETKVSSIAPILSIDKSNHGNIRIMESQGQMILKFHRPISILVYVLFNIYFYNLFSSSLLFFSIAKTYIQLSLYLTPKYILVPTHNEEHYIRT